MMENGSDPIAELRRRVLEELGEDGMHPMDLIKVKTDDQWLERFYRHQEHHMELALGMLVECLKWRVEYGVNDLTPLSFPRSFFEAGSLYSYTQDRQNFRILMFHVKLHQKESETLTEFKRFLVYWLEQIEAEHTRRVTVIFDMTDTGIANMDMEFLKFFISLFKFYYPSFLAHFLVYELPWILNTAWKLVRTWLSPKAVDKIKFVNRESIIEYIAPENLPAHMGGSSPFKYVPPTGLREEGPSRTASTASTRKKVHFAEEDAPSSKLDDSTRSDSDVSINGVTPSKDMRLQADSRMEDGCGRLLCITPPDELLFNGQPEQESVGILNLFNNKGCSVAFKVKTTSPEKYRVRPSSGIIKPGCQCDVLVHLQAGYQSTSLARDKFLVMAMELDEDPGSPQELNEMWRCAPKERIMERKLRCVLHHSPPCPTPCRTTAVCRSSGDCGHANMCVNDCSKQCTDDTQALMVEICHELRYLRRLMFAILFLLLALAVFLFIASTLDLPPLKGPKSYYFDGCGSSAES